MRGSTGGCGRHRVNEHYPHRRFPKLLPHSVATRPLMKAHVRTREPPNPRMSDFIALQSALAGEYSLDREIGRGGMGVVYLAREVRLSRPVAIKVLPPALADRIELREAFLRETQTAAALTHPNIVPVYAV